VRLSAALHHTDDPDTIFHDTYYHCYDVWGSRYGNAPKRVAEYYAKALAARKAGNWTAASRYVGLMAHYYADICNPMHTDQTGAEDAIHSSYESAAQDYTDASGENRGWVRFNGYDATINVVARVKTTAAASHRQYAALVSGYSAGGMTAAVVSITAQSMNRAANGLADLIISIQRKVNGGTTATGGADDGCASSGGRAPHRALASVAHHHSDRQPRAGCRPLASGAAGAETTLGDGDPESPTGQGLDVGGEEGAECGEGRVRGAGVSPLIAEPMSERPRE